MPARIVVVHDDPELTKSLVEHLGPGVAAFDDPVQALDFLRRARTVEFLITRLAFGNKQSLGLSLARMARSARPEVRVIFAGRPEHRQIARGQGEFLEEPVSATHIGMIVEWLRSSNGQESRTLELG